MTRKKVKVTQKCFSFVLYLCRLRKVLFDDDLKASCHAKKTGKKGGFVSKNVSWPIDNRSMYLSYSGTRMFQHQEVGPCLLIPDSLTQHLYNVDPTYSTFVQHCTNVIQMFCVCWGVPR